MMTTPRQLNQRAELFHQLAQLTSAGVGVIPALEQIKRSPPARAYREPLQRLLEELARAPRWPTPCIGSAGCPRSTWR